MADLYPGFDYHYSDFNPNPYQSEYNNPHYNLYPQDGRDDLLQDMVHQAEPYRDGFNIEGVWNDLTGKTEQARQFATEDYFLDREQEFQREREAVAMEYNSESARLQRMLDAGINPNLIGGSNNSSSFQAVSGPSASGNAAGSSASSGLASIMAALNNTVNTFAGARHLGAQIQNLNSDTSLKNLELFWKPLREDRALNIADQTFKNLQKQYDFSDEELDYLKDQHLDYNMRSPYVYYQAIADYNNALKEAELIDERIKSEQESQKVAQSTVGYNEAAAGAQEALGELYGSEKEKTDAEAKFYQDEYERAKKVCDGLPLKMDIKEKIARLIASKDGSDRIKGVRMLMAYNRVNSEIYDASVQDAKRNYWDQQWMKMGSAYFNNGASMLNMSNMAPYVVEFAK